MILIVCLDDENGMMFNKRRQSMDRCIRERILTLCAEKPLWMNTYSAGQFREQTSNLHIAENYLELAKEGEYCFVENTDVTKVVDRVERLVIFRWNRRYPADVKFPLELFSYRWTLTDKVDFSGTSHERITQEVYML
ncbi:MAG: ribonuclease Z [Oscillospiraceae bacterium]|nr:ribonuclease Z [Oscillospiraceae bacterium]